MIIKNFVLDVVDRLCVTFGSDMVDNNTYFVLYLVTIYIYI
jgi:hypothetical protein